MNQAESFSADADGSALDLTIGIGSWRLKSGSECHVSPLEHWLRLAILSWEIARGASAMAVRASIPSLVQRY